MSDLQSAPRMSEATAVRIFVLLRHGLGPEAWASRVEAGQAWESSPYKYGIAADQRGVELAWSADRREGRLGKFLRRAIRRMLGFDLIHVWSNRRALFSADVVWTHTEQEHLGVALLMRLASGRAKFKVVAQTIWLWDKWDSLPWHRKRLARWLLPENAVELVHSSCNLALSLKEVPGRQVVLCPFGSSGVEPEAGIARDMGTVMAAGNDDDRDWNSLARAAGMLPNLRFIVYSSSPRALAVSWPGNVQLTNPSSVAVLRTAYSSVGAVAVPLSRNCHASGATVAIEAMSADVPLVISDTGGIASYVKGAGVELVPVGDPTALAEGIRRALSNEQPPAGTLRSRRVERGLTSDDYVMRYLWITRSLVSGKPVSSAVSEYARVPPLPLLSATTGL